MIHKDTSLNKSIILFIPIGPGKGQILWAEGRSLQSGYFINLKTYENVPKFTMKSDNSVIETKNVDFFLNNDETIL